MRAELGREAWSAVAVPWLLAAAFLAYMGFLFTRYRTPLREVFAFYRALQGSSLARDLS